MPPLPPTTRQVLEPSDLEARTQAIGQELFALSRREHAHLSALNRWTAQVLSWCLADPALKGHVLRFIDVLPSLQGPRAVARHIREYFPATDLRLPPALRVGATLARPGLLTAPAVSGVVHRLVEHVARQFMVEPRPGAVAQLIERLAARGATCSFDILGEQVLSEAEADRYVMQCEALLTEAAQAHGALQRAGVWPICGPRLNLSVKPSALTPRFDPISPAQSVEQAAKRLLPLLQLADRAGGLINLDAERYELRDLTLALAKHLLVHPKVGRKAKLGVVVQAYLQDAEAVVEEWLAWLSAHERPVTIRLVKGAYWDYEVAQAAQSRRPTPVYRHKAESDLAFERLTRRLLEAHPLVTTAVASHNVRSIAYAMAVAESSGLPKDQLEFQLLYGMGEALVGAIIARGYPVRIYTPLGELIPGMAYLVRRILENTANESFLRQDFLEERSAEELLRPPDVPRPQAAAPAADGVATWAGEPFTDFSQAAQQARMVFALEAVRGRLGARYDALLSPGFLEAGELFAVRNPAAPSQTLGQVCFANLQAVNHAVTVANEAQPRWARTPVSERAACLRRAAALMRQERFELAAWEVLEVGKTWREADLDVVEAIDFLEYYAACMLELSRGRPLPQVPGERNSYWYKPKGVAVVIAPWNFPAGILTGMASAALVAGNAVILKPAEQSSVMGLHVARILRAAGVPSAICQCLPGWGHDVGAPLVRHPRTHVVLFTGSKAVGLSLVQTCAFVGSGQRFVKHVVAELGGKNAIIVDADADLNAAIQGTLVSAFGYGGQKCSAASRVIVHAAVYDRFLERLTAATDRLVVGDPADPATDLGPLINEEAQRRLGDALGQAGEVGTVAYRYPSARLPRQGYFVGPTVVTDVPPQHRLAREELFGPLVCVFRAPTFEGALALANDSDYALTGGVFSRSPDHVEQATEAFDVGNLYVNRAITGAVVGRQPFGGHRLSGLGTKAGGPDYLLQLLTPKTICANTTRHGMPLD